MSTFDLRATSGAVSSVLGRYTRQATTPPPVGDFSSSRRFNAYREPGVLCDPVRRFNALGQQIGTIDDGWNAATGRFTLDNMPTSHAVATRDEGGIIGVLGNDTATINANRDAAQAAINAACNNVNGGRVRLLAGARFGQLYVGLVNSTTRQTNRAWVVIETAGFDAVRPAGERHRVTDDASMATVVLRQSDLNQPALAIMSGTSFVRIAGVRVAFDGRTSVCNLGLIGTLLNTSESVSSINHEWLILDRVHVDGRSTPTGLQRGCRLFGDFIAVIESRFTEIGGVSGVECQALNFGFGRVALAKNCHFSHEGNGQGLIVGGDPIGSPDKHPEDHMLVDCSFAHSLQRGQNFKTHWEPKFLRRGVAHRCFYISLSPTVPGSFGGAISIKLAANGNNPADIETRDIMVHCCATDGSMPLLNITGRDADASLSPEPTRRIVVQQCLDPLGDDPAGARTRNGTTNFRGARMDLNKEAWLFHCTIVGPKTTSGNHPVFLAAHGESSTFRTDWGVVNCLLLMPEPSLVGSTSRGQYAAFQFADPIGQINGKAGWDFITTKTRVQWVGNVAAWDPTDGSNIAAQTIPGTTILSSYAAAQINADGTLQAGSPCRTAADDGGVSGCDAEYVIANTALARAL